LEKAVNQWIEKVWGSEEIIIAEPEYTFKKLHIKPGFQCSLHKHKNKTESFHVVNGIVKLEQRDVRCFPFEELLIPGDVRKIMPGTYHRFGSVHGATIDEVSTFDSPDDSYRLEESKKIPSSLPKLPK
jgi:mannose-6-phosphate isomerase-like protein (cupin superfamily)